MTNLTKVDQMGKDQHSQKSLGPQTLNQSMDSFKMQQSFVDSKGMRSSVASKQQVKVIKRNKLDSMTLVPMTMTQDVKLNQDQANKSFMSQQRESQILTPPSFKERLAARLSNK